MTTPTDAATGPGTLDAAMADAIRLLRRINRLEPLSGAVPRDLEAQLREIEKTIVRLCQPSAGTASSDLRVAAFHAAGFRQSLMACDVTLRMQTAEIAGFLTTASGRTQDAGVYRPDAIRRSSPGAWMSMRSSP
jgi:hypothetical protein